MTDPDSRPPEKAQPDLSDRATTAPDRFGQLFSLALDMRWSWNHAADRLWEQLDPVLWGLTHNPWALLQTLARDKIERLMSERMFSEDLNRLLELRQLSDTRPAWFETAWPDTPLKQVAYFSMEFMLSEALPIYSGGLGNVAGDQLKAASDLGVPVLGVGLLYQQGYFRQTIDSSGRQQALFPYNDPGQLPITPLRDTRGEWVRFSVDLGAESVWIRVWKVKVGRISLYLLDTNDIANSPEQRGITSELYGGNASLRLRQEIILGIGGWRLMGILGIHPQVCHLNEGHAAFAILERAREFMKETRVTFEVSLAATRAGNLFTTHTAVPAGFDLFDAELISRYLGTYAVRELGIPLDLLLGMGRKNPHDFSEPFNMAYLALQGSGRVNGVSALHGRVSREIFLPLFPRWPAHEVPVTHVTNGVHVASWDCAEADELWTQACGKNLWLGTLDHIEKEMRNVPDQALWSFRNAARASFVEYIRRVLLRERIREGAASRELEDARGMFHPEVLTIGFARRFATYKRPNLLLSDPERLARILTHPDRPVQLVIAGKAHPRDTAGQEMIHDWMEFFKREDIRKNAVFLTDYDMQMAERLVQGVDLWINTPRRPWEACGTSGMKVLVNGGLNLSELDGWWAEACSPEVGWFLGDGREHGDDPAWDHGEAMELYEKLEREIVPLFYMRNDKGISPGWVARMRESMARLTTLFSANRCVREYTVNHYIPAAREFERRSRNGSAVAGEILRHLELWKTNWNTIRFGDVDVSPADGLYLFSVYLDPGNIDPDSFRVELFANPDGERACEKHMMEPTGKTAGTFREYRVRIPHFRPFEDYTPRVVPFHEGLSVPLEASWISWER